MKHIPISNFKNSCLFTKLPIRVINGIYDFIGDNTNEYLNDWNELAQDRKGRVRIESDILHNCFEILLSNIYQSDENIKIVDVGCGEGYHLNYIKQGEKIGIDLSLLRLKQLDNNIVRVRASVESIPIVSSYFDLAICTDVFEHVKNPRALTDELYRLLKPGGILLFSTPWKQDLSVYDSDWYKSRFKLYSCRHRHSVDANMIRKYFSKFKIISETMLTLPMQFMEFKPYPIKFLQFVKGIL